MTNQLKEKLLAYGTKAEPFTVHNHIRVTDLQDGEARVELTLQPESLNRWGTAHGGILFALADNASIDFLDAAGLGSTLTAVGHVDRMGKSLCFCHTDITDETGRLLATLRTVMDLTGRPLEL